MKKTAIVLFLSVFAAASAVALTREFKLIKEFLIGYEEVPSVSTGASGHSTPELDNTSRRLNGS